MPVKARIFAAFAVLLACLCCLRTVKAGNDGFTVKRIGNIHPYGENAFRVTAPEGGELEIRIHDSICVYRTLLQRIPAGETTVCWDGCGYNRERLYEKSYTVTAELKTDGGNEYAVSFASPVEYALQCLQYALPSSDILYLDNLKDWFIEYRTVTKGTVRMELIPEGGSDPVFTYSAPVTGGKINRKDFSALAGKQVPEPGEYILSVYEETRRDERYDMPLTVVRDSPEPDRITETGAILPERGMGDAEIWDLMMKPSVVVDIDSFKHQEVYTEPDRGSASLGTLHGQSQALQVIRISGEWALVGAWNHEDAEYVEGWVPLDKLKTVRPQAEYGILIDKQKQTLCVYRHGEKIDTLLISSGRAEKNSLYQETSAGCFLTGYHRVNFSMNGKKYDYVIQYDGGNLLHQTPYDWGQQKKDFTLGRAYLGAKASHACIRIQPEPGDGGINAYWLFTHIPYHTRVMILDDPEERRAVTAKLKRTASEEADPSALRTADVIPAGDDETVCITFCGQLTAGGTRAFNSRKESLAAFADKNGYDKPFSSLRGLFLGDDLTCAFLGCKVQADPDVYPEEKNEKYAPAAMTELFRGSGIDLLACCGFPAEQTADIPEASLLDGENCFLQSIRGYRFGFVLCTEEEYIQDPACIDRKLAMLDESECDRTIMLFQWGNGKESSHSIVQEAMAHRSVRAGADLVIGNEEGTLRGADLVEGVPVVYSTGCLLDGTVSEKPKKQQGVLARIQFSFGKDGGTSVTLIPLAPYGNGGAAQNEYIPTADLGKEQFVQSAGLIRRDSTDKGLDGFRFYMADQ